MNNIFDKSFKRAGIILCYNDHILLGIDRASGGLTYFGGHCEHDDISIYHTALREYEEEGCDALPSITINDLKSCSYIYSDEIILFLVNKEFDHTTLINLNNNLLRSGLQPERMEMLGALMIHKDNIDDLCDRNIIYYKITEILNI